MSYSERIDHILSMINDKTINLKTEFKEGRKPTAASSEFLINKAQGDWAENEILKKANEQINGYVFIKYGANSDLIAGEEGFDDYYESYKKELKKIGKRPDILVFKQEDYDYKWGPDLSSMSISDLEEIVPKAVAGLEVRSSSFFEKQYEKETYLKIQKSINKALSVRDEILKHGVNCTTEKVYKILEGLDSENIKTLEFRVSTNKKYEHIEEVRKLFKTFRYHLNNIQKRDYLSFTPKVEDIMLVKKWIQTYNVPHYYIQVFMDGVYGISFENILHTVSNKENNKKKFFIEKDVKNQNKTTIKISVKDGVKLGDNDQLPKSFVENKLLKNGKFIPYIKYSGSNIILDNGEYEKLIS